MFAQSIHITGIVINKETNSPISSVSIFTQNNKTGTISTSTGKFELEIPTSEAKGYLYFQNIEYETDSILISHIHSPLSIRLMPAIYTLKEVYIMPDSLVLSILRKAYNKISDNYPNTPTLYEGFFQNSIFNEQDSLIELIEAELAIYKESYQIKKKVPGQIEILKSRMKQLQKSNVNFVGGAFTPIDEDYVLKRASFIQPQKFKNYRYKFTGIKTVKEKDCYEIVFNPVSKDSDNVYGKMYIEISNYAYVLFDICSEHPNNAKKLIGLIDPTQYTVQVNYEQMEGKWYLKQISRKDKYEHWQLDSSLFDRLDFFTTNIQTDSVRPIPIEKQLEYTDPIETKAETYRPNGWIDSNSIKNENPNELGFQFSSDQALDIFNQELPKKFSSTNTIYNIFSRITKGYGISYDFNNHLLIHQMMLGYLFTKKWNIQWQISADFFVKNVKYVDNSLSIKFRQNLNSTGYPVFLGTSLGIADIKYDGNYQFRKQAVVPQVSLSKRTSKYITIELFTNYSLPIHSNNDQIINHYPKIGFNIYIF